MIAASYAEQTSLSLPTLSRPSQIVADAALVATKILAI
jgi:hypothetical protein